MSAGLKTEYSKNAAIIAFEFVNDAGRCIPLEIEQLIPDNTVFITCQIIWQDIFIQILKKFIENIVKY